MPPAEPEQLKPSEAYSEAGPCCVTRTGNGKGKISKIKSHGRLLAELQRKVAARRAVAAEQAANNVGSDDLSFDAEQVEADVVEAHADADADANERDGADRRALPARFVAGSRHANVTTSPLLGPAGVSGTGPISAEADGAVSVEKYRALQIKLKTALADFLSALLEHELTDAVFSHGKSIVAVTDVKASSRTECYCMTDLSGKHFLLHLSSGDLTACLLHHVAHRSARTFACIVLLKWNGLVCKYVHGMQLFKNCPVSNATHVPAADVSHCD